MREIKFRAWDTELKMMVYENEQTGDTGYETNPVHTVNSIINEDYAEYIWMQYAGLKDRNRKEIYEGDILERKFSSLGYELGDRTFVSWDKYRYVQNWVMKFERSLKDNKDLGTWIESKNPVKLDLDAHLEDFEVIGNIYENPELLEAEE